MVEPPSAAPWEAASERDVLLATKLHVPRPRPDLIPRARFVAALKLIADFGDEQLKLA